MSTRERKLSPQGLEKFAEHIRLYGDPFRLYEAQYNDFQEVIAEQAQCHELGGPPPWYWRPEPYFDDEGASLAYYASDFINLS